ncbi:MAG: hypothetical protein BZY75_05420 [SAR202 cluster bacterium Io17-Chloro-G7]|nr:MAG: hypothetical protein BZY75_05420 [SAR202 cluster bacterium Io17-Chloro-G7]
MAATIQNNRWVRQPDDLAVQLREKQISDFFAAWIAIEEGTTGLLLVHGRYDQRLDPGQHVIEGFMGGHGKKTLVLVNLGEVMLHITLPRLLTKDPVPFGVETAITLRFNPGREALFLSNFMSGREELGASDMRRLVYPEVNEAAQDWASKYTIRQLAEDLSLRNDLAMALESHIRPVLDRYGLTFGRMEVRDFKCEIWDKSLNLRVETSLQVTQEQAELEGRKRLFDLAVETDIQDVTEETQATATYEKRIQLWQRMNRAANQEQMDKISSEADLVTFIRDTDKDRLLKEDEYERFKVALRDAGEDHERMRSHFQRVVQMEENYDFRRKELALDNTLSREQLEGEMGLERIRVESQLETDLKRTDLILERQRRENEHQRTEDDLESAARWERELKQARTESEAQGVDRESQRLDGELAIALQEKQSAQQRLDQQESMRLQQEQQNADQERTLTAQEAELNMRLRELKERHQMELESTQSMDAVSIHTLIAVAPGEKAPLLAELAKTEAFKTMSPEQILAIAAEKSPELGLALGEMAAHGDSEQAKAMYERLISEQKESASEARERQREMTQTMQEMFNKALETQAQVSSAFASGGGQGAQAPQAQAGSAGATPAPVGERVVVCRRCQQDSPVATRFCPNCGDTLMVDTR